MVLRRKEKWLIGALLAFVMVLAWVPGGTLTARAATSTGDFAVTGEASGYSYDATERVLTIKNGANVTISMAEGVTQTTTDRIEVESGATATITLSGVNIDVSGDDNTAAFVIPDNSAGKVTITLEDTNILKSGAYRAGLHKNGEKGTLIIQGTGSLEAYGGNNGAGIGGAYDGSSGNSSNITITGGTVTATGGVYGAGIGGGNSGSGSNITITGGTVIATGGNLGAGIGGGEGGSGSNITISGGTVTATGGIVSSSASRGKSGTGIGGGGGSDTAGSGSNIIITGGIVTANAGTIPSTATAYSKGAGIGGGEGSSGNTFSTTKDNVTGNAWIVASSISDTSGSGNWSGVIFNGTGGLVYGDSYTLTGNATIPDGATLTVDEGKTLTIAKDGNITGSGNINGNGTFQTENLTEDMITVSTDLVYNGRDQSDDIAQNTTATKNYCGRDFRVTGWTQKVEKKSAREYTVTYTREDNTETVTKTVTLTCPHETVTNGTCTVCGEQVAATVTVGEETTFYADITSAWTAAQTAGNAQVTLLTEQNVTETLQVAAGTSLTLEMAEGVTLSSDTGVGRTIEISGTFVLENGILKNQYAKNLGRCLYATGNGASVTIKGGTIEAKGEFGYALSVGEGATVTISGGTFSGTYAFNFKGAKAELSGGTFNGDSQAIGGSWRLKDLLVQGYAYQKTGDNSWASADDLLTAMQLKGPIQVVEAPVQITQQPESITPTYGDTYSLSVTAAPGDGATYRWYSYNNYNGYQVVENATGATFVPSENGKYCCVVTRDGCSVVTEDVEFRISPKPLTIREVTLEEKVYDGETTGTVKSVTFNGLLNGDQLVLDTDYQAYAEFADANAGKDKTATVSVWLIPYGTNPTTAQYYTLFGSGSEDGSVTAKGTILPKKLTNLTIELSQTQFNWDGLEKTPAVTVKDGDGNVIPEDSYTVRYENNKNPGDASVCVEGKNNYSFYGEKRFTIGSIDPALLEKGLTAKLLDGKTSYTNMDTVTVGVTAGDSSALVAAYNMRGDRLAESGAPDETGRYILKVSAEQLMPENKLRVIRYTAGAADAAAELTEIPIENEYHFRLTCVHVPTDVAEVTYQVTGWDETESAVTPVEGSMTPVDGTCTAEFSATTGQVNVTVTAGSQTASFRFGAAGNWTVDFAVQERKRQWSHDHTGEPPRDCVPEGDVHWVIYPCGIDVREPHNYVNDVCADCGAKRPVYTVYVFSRTGIGRLKCHRDGQDPVAGASLGSQFVSKFSLPEEYAGGIYFQDTDDSSVCYPATGTLELTQKGSWICEIEDGEITRWEPHSETENGHLFPEENNPCVVCGKYTTDVTYTIYAVLPDDWQEVSFHGYTEPVGRPDMSQVLTKPVADWTMKEQPGGYWKCETTTRYGICGAGFTHDEDTTPLLAPFVALSGSLSNTWIFVYNDGSFEFRNHTNAEPGNLSGHYCIDGVCIACDATFEPVARVGGEEYISLADAWDAAKAAYDSSTGSPVTVTLLADASVADTLSLNGEKIILEGGNWTVSGKSTIVQINNGELTLKSGTLHTEPYGSCVRMGGGQFIMENGTLVNNNAGGSCVQVMYGGQFTLNGGTLKALATSVYVGSGSFTMNGGEILPLENQSDGEGALRVDGTNATVRINGGTLEGTGYGARLEQNAEITITGGTFRGKTAEAPGLRATAELTKTRLSGGTFHGVEMLNGQNVSELLENGCAYYDQTTGEKIADTDVTSLGAVTVDTSLVRITAQPQNQTIYLGSEGSISVTVAASVADAIGYQWYQVTGEGEAIISDANQEALDLAQFNAGTYQFFCRVSLGDGHVDSKTATVTVIDSGAVLTGVSATLEGDIGLNYYITLPQSVIEDTGAYVLFTVNSESTQTMINEAASETDGTYKFTYRMNAKEMHDTVTFEVYNGSNQLIELYDNEGTKYEGSRFDYSLADYFEALPSNPSATGTLVDLAKATLAYGSYVQWLFDYKVETADSDMNLSDVTVETLEVHKMAKTTELPEGLTLSGITLILKTETTLCLYFEADDISKYSFILDGTAATTVETAGGLYRIKISDISAKDLDARHTLVIDGNCTLTFSALSYAYSVVNTVAEGALCDAVKALYKYNAAANAYFGA